MHDGFSGILNLTIGCGSLLLGVLSIILYFTGVFRSRRKVRLRHWPAWRAFSWCAGTFLAVLTLSVPFMEAAHHDFRLHMAGHLLLGMAAPLLLALGAPVTLLLRTLDTSRARKAAGWLKKPIFSFYRHPVTASVLNIGGLWVLYATPLFHAMHSHPIVYLIVHAHVFLAGYLFTVSMIYIDPAPVRHSPLFRTAVFIPALAAHGILSKYIYAYPPGGVPADQARQGAMLMYYGGDLIDLVLIILLFRSWYKQTGTRTKRFIEKKPAPS